MLRVRLIVTASVVALATALAGCSGSSLSMPDWMSFHSSPPPPTALQFESDPPGADVRTAPEDDDAPEEHRKLEHQSPIPAQPAQHHSDNCDGEEKTAARTQGRGMQHHLTGYMNVNSPFAVACHRQREQRGHERGDERPPQGEPRIYPAARNKGIREEEQFVREEAANGET